MINDNPKPYKRQQFGHLREQISDWDCLQCDTFLQRHGSLDIGLDTCICREFGEPVNTVKHDDWMHYTVTLSTYHTETRRQQVGDG